MGHPNVGTSGREEKSWGRTPTGRSPADSARAGLGLVRSAGSLDILIAGHALVNDATVLAADHDFAHIAAVTALQHEYIQPST